MINFFNRYLSQFRSKTSLNLIFIKYFQTLDKFYIIIVFNNYFLQCT